MRTKANKRPVLFLLIICVARVFSSLFSNLPGLDRFCKLKLDSIQCDINVVNFLDFKDVRKLLSDVSDNSEVILNITCGYIGQLRLPWPMKSRNIREILVDGCHIHGFYSEIKKPKFDFNDQLVRLQIKDSIFENSVIDAFNLFSTETSKSFECGQLTLNSLTMQNISHRFVLEPSDLSSLESKGMMMDADDLLLSNKVHRCVYPDLEEIDVSGNSDGLGYFVLPMENSEFPKLISINMSNNEIDTFPEMFITWEKVFPNIRYIDMSNNAIDTFNFGDGNVTNTHNRIDPLFVNMRNNLVSTVPQFVANLLERPTQIMVDLSDNPLICGCDTLIYKNHLQNIQRLNQDLVILKVDCLQASGEKIDIFDLRIENC